MPAGVNEARRFGDGGWSEDVDANRSFSAMGDVLLAVEDDSR